MVQLLGMMRIVLLRVQRRRRVLGKLLRRRGVGRILLVLLVLVLVLVLALRR